MRKLLLVAVVGTFMMSANSVSAQAMEEGNVGIDLYYGFPNLYKSILEATVPDSASNLDVGGVGPLGLRFEYMLADKVGLGLDIAYNTTSVNYTEDSLAFNTTTNEYDVVATYDYKLSSPKIGVMVVFNYHFIDNDQLDFFGTFGAGWKNRSLKLTSTNPNFTEEKTSITLLPISMRIGLGMRYFFTDNIGINLGVGFGQGGIANAGLSFKF
ncbi:MAG: opacity protein-like surface antigen [Flavobacteriaceae bacterium]|jgi:opacity protein-like surface antigen